MSSNSSSSNSEDSFTSSEIPLSRPARFWLILLFDVPSVICTLCLIIHIISNRTQRHALYSHTILLLLIFCLPTQLIDAGLHLFSLRYGFVQPPTPIICLLWWFVDYGIFAEMTMLFTWLAIERHILIFHDLWVANRRGRFLFHYLPLITIVTYLLVFYIVAVFLLPCENVYDYSSPYCGTSPCYESHPFLSLWEFIVHYCAPVILESIVSTALIIRVQYHKRRLHMSTKWRSHRRMIIQLALVSSINICLILPYYIISIAQYCGVTSNVIPQIELWFYFLSYWITYLFPFISLCQFPTLRKQIKKKLCSIVARRPRRIAAVIQANEFIPMDRRP